MESRMSKIVGHVEIADLTGGIIRKFETRPDAKARVSVMNPGSSFARV
jgi:hypothetical protein